MQGLNFMDLDFTKVILSSIKPNAFIYGADINNGRKFSKMDSAGLITVIEGGGSGLPNVIPILYAALVAAIGASTLINGAFYLITDFQTVYDRPDFDSGGVPKVAITTVYSANEPLLIQATSTNTIGINAYSFQYPFDTIQYDWTFQDTEYNGNGAKGRISLRIDNNGNEVDNDSRAIQLIRYPYANAGDTILFYGAPTTGTPAIGDTITGSGSGATGTVDVVASPYFGGISNVILKNVVGAFNIGENISNGGAFNGTLTNQNVIANTVYDVNDNGQPSVLFYQFGTGCIGNKIGSWAEQFKALGLPLNSYFIISDNVFLPVTSGYNTLSSSFGQSSLRNTIGGNAGNVKLGWSSQNCVIGFNALNINIEYPYQIYINDVGQDIYIRENCSGICIGANCIDINIGSACSSIYIYESCASINIGFESFDVQYLYSCNSISSGPYLFRSFFGQQCSYIYLGGTNVVIFGNQNQFMEIGNQNNLNFGDLNQQINIKHNNTIILTTSNSMFEIGSQNNINATSNNSEIIIGEQNVITMLSGNSRTNIESNTTITMGNTNAFQYFHSSLNLKIGNNALNNEFMFNSITAGTDLTGATHIYNNYQCWIFYGQSGQEKLYYFNGADIITVVAATA